MTRKARKLGSTEIEVSPLALGCWQFAGGDYWGNRTESSQVDLVSIALESGINFFDTAPAYGDGESERVLGVALKGRRDKAIIATKVSPTVQCQDDVVESCNRSLELLQTDHVDLLQMHWPARELPLDDLAAVIESLRASGKVRAFGVCNYGPLDLGEILEAGLPIVSNQLPYSLLSRSIEYEIVPLCEKRDISVLPYSPLLQGLLAGRWESPDQVPVPRARTRHFRGTREQSRHGEEGCESETFAALESIRKLADANGVSMSDLAVAWVSAQNGVASVIVGAGNSNQLKDNLAALDIQLDEKTLRELDGATQAVKSHLGKNPDLWMGESRYR